MSDFDIADCGSNSWNTYLSDINMCVADGLVAETLAVANYTCNKHNSSILSYRLVALLRSSMLLRFWKQVCWVCNVCLSCGSVRVIRPDYF